METYFLKSLILLVIIIPTWIIDANELVSFSEPIRMFFLGTLLIGFARICRSKFAKNKINESIQNNNAWNHPLQNIPKVSSPDENFMSFQMMSDRRSYVERRSGKDRRNLVNIHRLPYAGKEKRTKNRRLQIERRKILVRINKWSDVYPNEFKTADF